MGGEAVPQAIPGPPTRRREIEEEWIVEIMKKKNTKEQEDILRSLVDGWFMVIGFMVLGSSWFILIHLGSSWFMFSLFLEKLGFLDGWASVETGRSTSPTINAIAGRWLAGDHHHVSSPITY